MAVVDENGLVLTTLGYLEKDGCFLMMLRNKKENDLNQGKWIGVGGHLEEGENSDECFIREVREETGLELADYRLRGKVYFLSDTWDNEVMYLYTGHPTSGEVTQCDEGSLEWIPLEKVMSLNLWEGDHYFIEKLVRGEDYFEMTLRYEGDKLVGME